MATSGQEHRSAAADEVATALGGADLVRLESAASGDALAGTGTLAAALRASGTPFQASVVGPASADAATDADVTVAVGSERPGADLGITGRGSASVAALAVARALGTTPDRTVALAGAVAAGASTEELAELAADADLTARPGVAVPTTGLADGLAHSTLFHAPFSGDVGAAEDALASLSLSPDVGVGDLDDDDRCRIASRLALAAGATGASERAARAIERAIRPYDGGPFPTVGGFADVLDATARTRPGLGLGLALGDTSVRAAALDAWRAHAGRAHEAVRSCERTRYDGLVVARADSMPVGTVARLLAEYVAAEPVVLAVTAEEAAVDASPTARDGSSQPPDVGSALAAAADAADGAASGSGQRARATFAGDAEGLIGRFREAR